MVVIYGDGRVEARPCRSNGWMSHSYPSGRGLKALVRFPLVLWRMGFGPLLGRGLLVLTTRGRRSGLPRRVMVEYHNFEGGKVVPCAFGERADWYWNVMADPRVTIQTAHGTEHVLARRVVDDEELLGVYRLLRHRNPVMLDAYLQSVGVRPDPADILAKKSCIHWITFEPTDEPTPPPLETDLVWVWPLLLVGMLAVWLVCRLARKR